MNYFKKNLNNNIKKSENLNNIDNVDNIVKIEKNERIQKIEKISKQELDKLRKEAIFVFNSYEKIEDKENIELIFKYSFKNTNLPIFFHKIKYKKNSFFFHSEQEDLKKIKNKKEEKLIQYLGIIEGINYYKILSPKTYEVPFNLSKIEKSFFEKIYFNGLGEYRFLNNLIKENEKINDFIKIETKLKTEIETEIKSETKTETKIEQEQEQELNNPFKEIFRLNRIIKKDEIYKEIFEDKEVKEIKETKVDKTKILVPIGGGKDSLASLKILESFNREKENKNEKEKENNNKKFEIIPVFLNTNEVRENQIKYFGIKEDKILSFNRIFDKEMIKLNTNGYLNGHIPFSAVLSFALIYLAYRTNINLIALSNESSASESNVEEYENINHQYSKSFEYEEDLIYLINKYISKDIHYFSLLRGLNEIQIAKIVSKDKKLCKIFRSCNVGSKETPWIWCENCPKCLFVYIIFSQFFDDENMKLIFKTNIFENIGLEKTFLELINRGKTKPFECVGTYDEVRYSLIKIIDNKIFNFEEKIKDKINEKNKEQFINNLPYLLKIYFKNYYFEDKRDLVNKNIFYEIEETYSNNNLIPKILDEYIKKYLKGI